MSAPLVSIVLVTKNGAGTLPALLEAVSRQRVAFPFELVAVDSGSTDGTVTLLEPRVDRLVRIPPAAFDHGLTRNLGVEHSQGSLVVLLVQDAVPASDTWLAELTTPLTDVRIAGAFARQRPQPHASAIAKYYHERWVAALDAPRALALDPAEIEGLEPMQRYQRCVFDNVCSCIRRDVWERHPFRSTPIGEDLEWAREVLLAGYQLAYAPKAVVIHSHDRPVWYELARTYALHRRLYELFQLRTIPDVRILTRAIVASSRLHLGLDGGIARALSLAVVWPLGQYLGGLTAARGWKPLRSRIV